MRSRFGLTVAVAAAACVICPSSGSPLVADGDQFSDWGTPVNLGPVVNSAFGDFFPCISKDALSLYFSSSRSDPNGFGGWDIDVSQRSSIKDPWGPPLNLGKTINSSANEGRPILSPDEHVLFFASNRTGGFGGNDIWASRRHDKRDDFGWQEPENLGSGVNTDANEASPNVFEDERTGVLTLYFDSNRLGGFGPFTDDAAHNGNDIYVSVPQSDGTFGPATLVTELSTSSVDRQPFVRRRDGMEIFFASDRPGSLSTALDLWVSTRASTLDPWSTPVNLGPVVNSGNAFPSFTGPDAGPALSFDGKTLYFQSNRPGVVGNFDLYMTTREKLK
jgi:hypothetical protein